uniref:Cytoplasmic dynein 2 light intermediate chain 1 n=1 Tax=Pyramimonas obovata TaxID=1411642 RepID=A0A7S0RPS7_9CHLO|mmetsp:Transcript_38665/g.84094  ORF Transcript_38665/g.84094 Transcript_38665/m.84094 type:complete len:399 (+) Transcript_38665:213-1409(+)|eukprot:CAMPEP_0118937018 /NCGR_PEP_ID=MMETSP1169-20130426/21361_1 /TAXON_ID=36882 /ORGANISM="Pyramimonas obovata, Strain CCMP722" /LENGTH=398 /DNA_ID=CAMNT_0006880515 /DNA_START=201 /DNA_END=1397 /DNA_ORIENTATION=-
MAADGTPWGGGADNLWTKILAHNKELAKQPGGDQGRPDANLYIVGNRGYGKSTMLNRLLYPDKTDVPRSTEGMEYTYARKQVHNDRKDIAHIWELAGSESLCEEVTNSDNLFLGMRQVATAVVCITLDLSKPSEVLDALEFWLNKIKAKVRTTYDKLERRGSKLPDQLKLRAKKVFGAQHEDKDAVTHTGISLVIVATKYDSFKDHDAEVKKIMSRTLRYYAHLNGAALLYLGGLGPQKNVTPKDATEYKALLQNFRALVNNLIFAGPDRKISSKLQIELDHLKPMVIPAGVDKFKDIGRPKGGTGVDAIAEWRAVFHKLFPPTKKENEAEWTFDQQQYAEPLVDSVVQQKNAEVAAYKKQLETAAAERQQALHRQQLAAKQAQARKAAPPPRRPPPK